ncbi:MAG: hypothetical protein ACRDQB_07605 [Thermocrispum sp.]
MRDRALAAAVVLVVLAALAAGWFGFSWLDASRDGDVAYARERDTVLRLAGDGLATLHTVDHSSAERDVGRWLDVTAGELHRDLRADQDGQVEQARETRAESTAKLVRAAVTDLDAHAGTARVIAVLDVRLDRRDAKPDTDRRRMNANLARGAQGWRIVSVEAAS